MFLTCKIAPSDVPCGEIFNLSHFIWQMTPVILMCSLCPGPHFAYLCVYNTFACNHSCWGICDVIRSAFCSPLQRHNMSPIS